ncbi:uncharacterized protein ACA1_326730 [Acanthamoeba castellanii str. Neff]|uniref:Uncharacterized protein n=1 Tax=Acanthamoeba castellanii (strain ATCC 30010 / Neff) TaxID=1257118 RepID=L8HKH7_ACACF|nr:uncharacterized protein ACA1_326730 [Acanthamoeba castellanii str. Neff]ELR25715.1 hypothetical protein ACA1_326730 [Acanthamoeba castellanii str. Neff]
MGQGDSRQPWPCSAKQYKCPAAFKSAEYNVATCYVEEGQWGALALNFTSFVIHRDLLSETYSPYVFNDTGRPAACNTASQVDTGSSAKLGLGGCTDHVYYHPAGGGPSYYSLAIRPANWTNCGGGGAHDNDADDDRWMVFGIVAIAVAGGVILVVGVAAAVAFVVLRRASYSQL